MSEKRMHSLLLGLVMLCAASLPLSAGSLGISLNGTCEAGSCPAATLAFNATDTLPVDIGFTLPDGDMYLIFGSFQLTNNSNGGGFSVGHDFEVMYEGNPAGGASAADTINVEQFDAFQTVFSSVVFDRDLIGAFSSGIATSSSASSCVNGSIGCLGPSQPPGSFNLTTSFSLNSTGGVFVYNPTFTSNFGAGSSMGSFIVWGQTTPIPAPTPEPGYFGLLAAGMGAIAARLFKKA